MDHALHVKHCTIGFPSLRLAPHTHSTLHETVLGDEETEEVVVVM
jgi:hypothetical protein